MLSLAKKVLAEYKPFIMQMWVDQFASEITNANITTFLNVQNFAWFALYHALA
jgi:sugar (pentulose or hexulose) kinase